MKLKFQWLAALALSIAPAGNCFASGPPTPTPLSATNGASVQTPLTLSWSAVNDSAGIIVYSWEISASSSFTSIAFQNGTTDKRATPRVISPTANTSGAFRR